MSENKNILQAISKSRTGKRHDMETLEGYYFYPCKYSVEAVEKIESYVFEQIGNKKNLMSKISKKAKNGKIDEKTMLAELDGKDLMTMYKATDKGLRRDKEYLSILIKYGIGPNNFGEDINVNSEGALVTGGIPQPFVDGILENSAIADEIVNVITICNSPLINSQ